MSSVPLLLVVVSSIALQFTAVNSIGVCYGVIGYNLPSRQEAIGLYKSNGIRRMRIYFPDEQALQALRGSNIEVLLDVPKETLQSLSNPASANNWVRKFVVSYSDVNIKYIAVGNVINPDDVEARYVLPAMQNIQKVISAANLQGQIKVSTAIKMDLLGNSYPPNNGKFTDSATQYIKPIINFLVSNGAPLLANVYPYFVYSSSTNNNVALEYALFTQEGANDIGYRNLFDEMLDSIYYALEKIGAPNLQIVVSESGWPSDGGDGASVENARTYYQNLINHVKGGTPKRGGHIETYLFAMFDENLKPGEDIERNFGLFSANKSPKYGINFNSSYHYEEQRIMCVFS